MRNIESFIDRISAIRSGFDELGMRVSGNWYGEESVLFFNRFEYVSDQLAKTIRDLNEIEEQIKRNDEADL